MLSPYETNVRYERRTNLCHIFLKFVITNTYYFIEQVKAVLHEDFEKEECRASVYGR